MKSPVLGPARYFLPVKTNNRPIVTSPGIN
jgi:hypothetical protein